jgi:adenosylcobinamide-GDP ribazoletransferase
MRKYKERGSSFLTTFSLVSRIRIVRQRRPQGEGEKVSLGNFKGTLFYLPVVGFFVSVILFGLFTGLSFVIPEPFILILIVIVLQYFLFNLFHLDGILDTADAFVPFVQRERRLEILKDLRLGSFAFFAGAVYIAAKLYILTKSALYFHILDTDPLSRYAVIFLFFTYPVTGRAAAAFVPLFTGPAKKEGLGGLLTECKAGTAVVGACCAVLPALGLFLAAYVLKGYVSLLFLFAFTGKLIAGAAAGFLYRRKAGGYTGDAFGFAVEIGELAHIAIFYMFLVYGLG